MCGRGIVSSIKRKWRNATPKTKRIIKAVGATAGTIAALAGALKAHKYVKTRRAQANIYTNRRVIGYPPVPLPVAQPVKPIKRLY